jgi:NADH-quinone oxidoreductase subunit B
VALRPDEPHDRPVVVKPSPAPPAGAVVIPPAQVRRSLRSTDLDQVVMTTTVEKVFKMATANSMWPFGFGLACCAMEMIAMISSARYDVARFGSEVVRATPRQSDLMIVSGRVAHKMAEPIRQLYEQMLEPKYVMAMGACSSTGGMFANYSILQGVDKIVPVDVYVPGCPPRPEAVMEGLMVLQQRIKSGIPSASLQQESQS